MKQYSQTGQRRATEKPQVINGHLKILSQTILFQKHIFDNVSTFFLPEINIKKYFQTWPTVKF